MTTPETAKAPAAQKAAASSASKLAPIVFEKLTDIDLALYTATAKGWRPEPGDEIRGRVLAVKIGQSDIGGTMRQYPIVFVLPTGATADTTAIAIHAFHSVLLNEFLSQRPAMGDMLFVRSLGDLGKEAPKGMSAPEIYAVQITKPRGAPPADPWVILTGHAV